MKTPEFEELLERVKSIDLLRLAIEDEDRPGVQDVIKVMHEAALKSLSDEWEFQDDDCSQTAAEGAFRHILGVASAIYAIACNWSERDASGFNPALAALLDQIEYKGDRYLFREFRL